MASMDIEQVVSVISQLCARLGDEYSDYHVISPGTLGAEACPNLVFHGKKKIYSALLGNNQTVVNDFKSGKKLAVFSDITRDSLLVQQRKRSPTLSPRQQERIEASRYDENADPLQLVQQVEDAKELHLFAANWNWDDLRTPKLLRSIIENPLCDRGTVLMLYWRMDGLSWYENRADVPDWEVELFDLARTIENLMLKGAFRQQDIGFDPKDETQLGGNYRFILRNAKRTIPPIMLDASPGKPLMEIF